MPYWIRGRDRETGRALEPFPSDAPSEMAARVDAIASGIIVESITAVDAPPGERPMPPLPLPARAGSRTPHAARYHDDDDPYRSYEAIVGPRGTMYYLRRFVDFDRARRTRATWHWPAFFVAFFWLVYRKMWTYAAGYLVAMLIAGAAAGILAGLIARLAGAPAGSKAFNGIVDATAMVYATFALVIPALYANALYHRHCRREMERARAAGSSEQQRLDWLAHKGGTQAAGVFASAVLIALCIAYLVALDRMH
jgi:hypothetical protein